MVGRTGSLMALSLLLLGATSASAEELGPEHLLLVCNEDSPASCYIVDLYRTLYPQITEQQVVYIDGLWDAAAVPGDPADEILFREEFEEEIAQPIRDHLIANNLVNQIRVIVTTAGIPYRIEDDNEDAQGGQKYPDVIKPAGTSVLQVLDHVTEITAAAVESDLAVLFHIDPQLPTGQRMPLQGRMTNVYSGYRTSITAWQNRDILGRIPLMSWTTPWAFSDPPWMEGTIIDEGAGRGRGVENRTFSPADIYLTARLDGPRTVERSPIFAVGAMLLRAQWACNPQMGVNPWRVRMVMGDAPGAPVQDVNRAYNTDGEPDPGDDYLLYLTNPPYETPPDMHNPYSRDDLALACKEMTGSPPVPGVVNLRGVQAVPGLSLIYDGTSQIINSGTRQMGDHSCLALMTFGVNGDDGRPPRYLLTGGPDGGPLMRYCPGACFAAHESKNAVTLFISSWVNQGLIAEFIESGGTAAAGFAFEPYSDAIIDAEFFYLALVNDADGDDHADLTAVEAFFSGMPFISWAGLFIGDPLMRLAYNENDEVVIDPEPVAGDCDGNRFVNVTDLTICAQAFGSVIGDPSYDHRADQDYSLHVDITDFVIILENYHFYGEDPSGVPPSELPGDP